MLKLVEYIEQNSFYTCAFDEQEICVYSGSTCVAIISKNINGKLRIRSVDSEIQSRLKDLIQTFLN